MAVPYQTRMSRWLIAWMRAVLTPAWRRAAAVWVGAAIGGGIVFGPTAMHPHDVTELAHGVPAVGGVLAITWLLVFTPTARVLVRAEGARYLRSLPHPRTPPIAIAAVALVVLQLPWLLLWIIGDGARGLVFVLALSIVIAAVAALRLRPRKVRFPPWTRAYPALRGVYLRALKRRAGDALVRGVGLALLAGLAAALVVRNNGLVGRDAAALGAGAIAVVLVPGYAGALMPLVEAQRASAWLSSSLGMSPLLRLGVLATVVIGVYLVGTLVAVGALALGFATLFEGSASATNETLAWIGATGATSAIAMGLVATRALVVADRQLAVEDRSLSGAVREVRGAPVQVVSGTVVASAVAIACLGWLGVYGAAAAVGIGLVMLLTVRSA